MLTTSKVINSLCVTMCVTFNM